MPADEWAAFNRSVLREARRLKLPVERLDPGLLVIQGLGERGLLNLAQLCHAAAPTEWTALIERHLRIVTDPTAFTGFHPDLLRIRLVPDSAAPASAEPEAPPSPVIHPYAESVVATLTVDLPTTVRIANTEEVTGAGLGIDEAWSRAWAQTRSRERPDRNELLGPETAAVHIIEGPSFFTSSLVEFLPDLLPGIDLKGALVSIPRRHTILDHAIHDLSTVEAVQVMLPLTRRIHADGPGSVSAHLYWWRPGSGVGAGPGQGHLAWLPSYLNDDTLEFHPSPDFVELLNTLGPAA